MARAKKSTKLILPKKPIVQKPGLRKLKTKPIFRLPLYRVQEVYVTLAETIDWGIQLVKTPDLWAQTRGDGINVAVLDTGVALNHPDLADAIADAKDFTRSPSGPSDTAGHGTHVAGTIGARENGAGLIGVAPRCKLFIGKVLGDDGAGTAESVAQGIYWAIDKKVDVISMSLGSPVPSTAIYRAVQAAYAAGIAIICAAGNEGPNFNTVGFPGQYDEVIAVGAIDRGKNLTNFSSRGEQVDIVAPGDDILSCYPPRGYARLSGTSMATPLVSGVVALMLSIHKKFGGVPINNNADILQLLYQTAIDLGPKGRDVGYGYGLINPEELLKTVRGASSSVSTLLLSKADLTASGFAKLEAFLKDHNQADEVSVKLAAQ